MFSPATNRYIMIKTVPAFFAAMISVIASASMVDGAIVSLSGDIQEVSPPPSVAVGEIQSDTLGIVFQERSDYQLLNDTRVSIPGAIGVYDEGGDMMPTDIQAGMIVDSHLLHFDQLTGAQDYVGSVQFADPIIGVMLLPFALGASDLELGAPGTVYPVSQGGGTFVTRRGLDFGESTQLDTLTIVDNKTIQFSVTSGNLIDQIRVITSATAVPEPSVYSVLILLALGCVSLRRSRV